MNIIIDVINLPLMKLNNTQINSNQKSFIQLYEITISYNWRMEIILEVNSPDAYFYK
ncbi:hypothetical protein J2Z80_001196 [Thermoanaerobacterium butyriciformans]|uniref:Uncharacterized protein n=1 Tax=Thermoanaerobacterium butyriciformans TaxID=1702242 RepID=A0ABS4NDB7_9THEO|nr:hypothetical protein [Thermoanaerobacterium butyriciformans]